jgi:peptidyl-dipeptidase Dcp
MNPSHSRTFQQKAKTILSNISTLAAAGAIALGSASVHAAASSFGPDNPFYAASTLPFQAPPFDRIKNSDYQTSFRRPFAP